jgi:hypothetical protein
LGALWIRWKDTDAEEACNRAADNLSPTSDRREQLGERQPNLNKICKILAACEFTADFPFMRLSLPCTMIYAAKGFPRRASYIWADILSLGSWLKVLCTLVEVHASRLSVHNTFRNHPFKTVVESIRANLLPLNQSRKRQRREERMLSRVEINC